jgi:hypothetical protein
MDHLSTTNYVALSALALAVTGLGVYILVEGFEAAPPADTTDASDTATLASVIELLPL